MDFYKHTLKKSKKKCYQWGNKRTPNKIYLDNHSTVQSPKGLNRLGWRATEKPTGKNTPIRWHM